MGIDRAAQWDVMTGISHRDRFEYYHEQRVNVEVVRVHPMTEACRAGRW